MKRSMKRSIELDFVNNWKAEAKQSSESTHQDHSEHEEANPHDDGKGQ